MIPLGIKHRLIGSKHWYSLRITGRPTKMPDIPSGHTVLCGYGPAENELIFACENLKAMQMLYDAHVNDATGVSWYHTAVFVMPYQRISRTSTACIA